MNQSVLINRGDLEVGQLIFKGGQASIFEAALPNGRPVALKLYDGGPHSAQAFEREVSVLSHARHRSIIGMHGYFASAQDHGLVLDLIRGCNLAEVITFYVDDPVLLARYCMFELLDALHYLHQSMRVHAQFPKGVIHADISPENILVREDGSLALIDFGSALVMREPFGKKNFMAPELLDGASPSAESDLYSLGAVVVHLLSQNSRGPSPFAMLDKTLKIQHPDLFFVLRACLAPSPGFRPKHAKLAREILFELSEQEKNRTKQSLATHLVRFPQRYSVVA